MRLLFVVVVIAMVILCYIGAGAPSVFLLFKPAVIGQALALKPLTWHWPNRADRSMPIAELLASRFYVLLVAALCTMVAGCAFGIFGKQRRFAYMFSMSIAVIAILIYAQFQAYYTVA